MSGVSYDSLYFQVECFSMALFVFIKALAILTTHVVTVLFSMISVIFKAKQIHLIDSFPSVELFSSLLI